MENELLNTEADPEQPDQKAGIKAGQPAWFQNNVAESGGDKPQQGQILKGKITKIEEKSILLNVGFEREAIVPFQDLDKVEPEYLTALSVGDEVFVSVTRTPLGDDDLLVSLSKGLAHETWLKITQHAENNDLLELEIADQNRGGLMVDFENVRGFIPNSHIPSIRRGTGAQKAGEIKAELIGKKMQLKVIEFNPEERRLVFSARVDQKGQRQAKLDQIQVGSEYKSRIVNVVDFGIFVDLDGIDGLVHKSEIGWERLGNPKKEFKIGDEIEVKVLEVDREKERVSLSRKILLPNPWLKLAEKYQVGDLVEGVVISVVEFGAFVELQQGLQGLVHISEIGYLNTDDPKAAVKKGDPVLVKILGLDPDRERVSLSMRKVPVSEQMDWMMNLEDAQDADRLDINRTGNPELIQEMDPELADPGSAGNEVD